MEPVTHVLTGMCLARTGLRRRAAYTTVVMATAAEFPDIDTLWGLRGPISSFQHHRGITHTFVGIPFEAALLVLVAFLWDRWSVHKPRRTTKPHSVLARQTPRQWASLYGFALLALLSHILLDYTNNYGVRPFYPFNGKWYAASIVFIVDPLLLLMLAAGLLMPSLFGLINQEVSGRRGLPLGGVGWARAAIVGVVLLWSLRAYEHTRALALAATQTLRAPGDDNPSTTNPDGAETPLRPLLTPLRSLAGPDPFSPFRWYLATDFGPAYQLTTADTRRGTLIPDRMLTKATTDPLLLAAEHSRLGQVYLDWSSMPWITKASDPSSGSIAAPETTVYLQDLRFMGALPILQRRGRPPLTGEVVLSPGGEVVDEGIDGKFGK